MFVCLKMEIKLREHISRRPALRRGNSFGKKCGYRLNKIYIEMIILTRFSCADCAWLVRNEQKIPAVKLWGMNWCTTLPKSIFRHLLPVTHNPHAKNVSKKHMHFYVSLIDICWCDFHIALSRCWCVPRDWFYLLIGKHRWYDIAIFHHNTRPVRSIYRELFQNNAEIKN